MGGLGASMDPTPQWSHDCHIFHSLIHKCLHRRARPQCPADTDEHAVHAHTHTRLSQCPEEGSGLGLGPHCLATEQRGEWLCLPPAPVAGGEKDGDRRREGGRQEDGGRQAGHEGGGRETGRA